MTYRVARSYSEHGEIDLVNWCECGSHSLGLFSSSESVRVHFCLMRVQSRVERLRQGVAKLERVVEAACVNRRTIGCGPKSRAGS